MCLFVTTSCPSSLFDNNGLDLLMTARYNKDRNGQGGSSVFQSFILTIHIFVPTYVLRIYILLLLTLYLKQIYRLIAMRVRISRLLK